MMELNGKILIAMPGMADPRFAHSIVLICTHSEDHTMGLIINKPTPDLSFPVLLAHLGIESGPQIRTIPVQFGGPVDRGRGFVLHSPDWQGRDTLTFDLPDGTLLTSTLDILEAMANGQGPRQAMMALGYAGWGPGQLEAEISRNDWLIADACDGLIFSAPDHQKWAIALRSIGVDPLGLSATAGRA